MLNGNPLILRRLDELIAEGERIFEEYKEVGSGRIDDPVSAARWITSCLNVLDRLSVTTNRFVRQFEAWITTGPSGVVNIGVAIGVLKSAKDEAVAKMRNDAAHGGEFTYRPEQISEALSEVRTTLEKILSAR